MEDDVKQELIDKYNIAISKLQQNNINASNMGFVVNDCNIAIYSILIHCIENMELFTDIQLNNIQNYLNKLNYVG